MKKLKKFNNPPIPLIFFFFFFVFYFVPYPFQNNHWKRKEREGERERNYFLVVLFLWHQRSPTLDLPNCFPDQCEQLVHWEYAVVCHLGTLSWPLCCIWKSEVPCSTVPVLVFKDGGFDFQEGRRWKERKWGRGRTLKTHRRRPKATDLQQLQMGQWWK